MSEFVEGIIVEDKMLEVPTVDDSILLSDEVVDPASELDEDDSSVADDAPDVTAGDGTETLDDKLESSGW